MTGKIINLKAAQKTRARAAKSAKATQNAAKFGRTKAQKQAETRDAARLKHHLDNHERARDEE